LDRQDEGKTLYGSAEEDRVVETRTILDLAEDCPADHTVDITEVPDFNKMYELYDNTTLMFFFR
jgi:DIM1 family U5 snRNP protein